jgi:translation initiation factor 3 subunit L
MILTIQWVNDIIQEFVYQFQGFCQYRCQVATRNAEDLKVLQANRSVWTLPSVLKILGGLVRASTATEASTAARSGRGPSELHRQFGSFAAVEMARLECLLGDYTASLKALSTLNLNDRSEIFMQLPTCQVNVFYHAGICHLMLRRYADAIETFSDVILHVSRMLKPGAGSMNRAVSSLLQKILDKILAMTSMAIALCPGHRVDDQVRDLVEAKWGDRLRRMNGGEIQAFVDLFEQTCPKFISPIVPDYSVAINMGQDAYGNQVSMFIAEAMQQTSVLKIRSYMRLYASIDISKLARFADVSEPAFISQLISFRHKSMEIQAAPVGEDAISRKLKEGTRTSTSDVQYHIKDQALMIDVASHKSDKNRAVERFFAAGVRKHAEIIKDLNLSFKTAGVTN